MRPTRRDDGDNDAVSNTMRRGLKMRLIAAAGIKDANNGVRQLKVDPLALPTTGGLQYKSDVEIYFGAFWEM